MLLDHRMRAHDKETIQTCNHLRSYTLLQDVVPHTDDTSFGRGLISYILSGV